MKLQRHIFTPLILFALSFNLSHAFAETVILSDFDDTILESRKAAGGTFSTKVVLYRIPQKHGVLHSDLNSLPEVIEISSTDFYAKVQKHLARSESEPGPIKKSIKLDDGREVKPGMYMLRGQESFKYFQESYDGRNHLLEDFKRAEKNDINGNWKGPFWDKMVEALSEKESAKNFGLITSRGHSNAEWEEFFKYLQSKKYINHLPNFKLIFALSRPEHEKFNLTGNEADYKANVVDYIVGVLKNLKPSSLVLDPDGVRFVESIYIVFAENNKRILKRVTEVLRSHAQARSINAKFGIFNSGLETEVKKSRNPRFSIIQSSGTMRAADTIERHFNIALQCVSFF